MRAALLCRSFADLVNGEDVGMVETGRRARFLFEPADALLLLCEGGGQQLERDFAAEPRVFGQINFAHPTGANQRERFIGAEAPAHERRGLLSAGHLGDHPSHLPGDEALRLLARLQQRFDLAPQLVVIATSPRQEFRAGFGLKLHRGMVQLADPPVLFRCHLEGSFRFNSRNNHASARLQSRRTVLRETLSASAVSSKLSPPKKRSSTPRACRGSIFSNAFNASSSATKSALFSCVKFAASDSETCSAAPPPRFSRWLARAKSTRICRMIRAASPKKWARFCHSTFCQSIRRIKASLTNAVVCRMCPWRSPAMWCLARRCSSAWTKGVSCSSAAASPLFQATSS